MQKDFARQQILFLYLLEKSYMTNPVVGRDVDKEDRVLRSKYMTSFNLFWRIFIMQLKLWSSFIGLGMLLGSCGENGGEESKAKLLREDSPKLANYTNFKGAKVQEAWNVRYTNSLNGTGTTLAYAEYGFNDAGVAAFDNFATSEVPDGTYNFPRHQASATHLQHNWLNFSPFNSDGADLSFVATYQKKIGILPYSQKVITMWGAADDGIRVRIVNARGEEVMSAWNDNQFWSNHGYLNTPRVSYTFPESSQYETYAVIVDYYENSGLAQFDFEFDINDNGYTPPVIPTIPAANVNILDSYGVCGSDMIPNCSNSGNGSIAPSNGFNIKVGACHITAFEIWEVVQKNGTACKAKCVLNSFVSGVHTKVDGLPNYADNNSFFVVKSSDNSKVVKIDNKTGDQTAIMCN